MSARSRRYQGEEDFHLVRRLLVESYGLTGRPLCWGIERWENTWCNSPLADGTPGSGRWADSVRLWENQSDCLMAAVTPEAPGEVHLQIHPNHRGDEALIDDMLAFAEAYRRDCRPVGVAEWLIRVYAHESDVALRAVLASRGYGDRGPTEVTRRRSIDLPIPSPALPDGYVLRTLRLDDREDLERYCEMEYATFGKTRWEPETVRRNARAPSYRDDLDLVVTAPDGSHAAFTTVWHDDSNQIGFFEPVGTHPEHRRRGLALALINEGLLQLKTLGATTAYVGTGFNSPANHLYEAAGFRDRDVWNRWAKDLG